MAIAGGEEPTGDGKVDEHRQAFIEGGALRYGGLICRSFCEENMAKVALQYCEGAAV